MPKYLKLVICPKIIQDIAIYNIIEYFSLSAVTWNLFSHTFILYKYELLFKPKSLVWPWFSWDPEPRITVLANAVIQQALGGCYLCQSEANKDTSTELELSPLLEADTKERLVKT